MATTSASDERACAPGMVSAGYAASYFGAPVAVELAREADLLLSGELPHEISHLDFWTLIYLHVAHTNDEAHGYAARRVPARSWSAVFAAVNQMRTLGDGLSKLVQISPIIRSNTRIRMAADLDTVRIDIFACEEIGDPQGRERYVESIALIVHCALLWMAKKPFQPAFVRVSQALAAIGDLQKSAAAIKARVPPAGAIR